MLKKVITSALVFLFIISGFAGFEKFVKENGTAGDIQKATKFYFTELVLATNMTIEDKTEEEFIISLEGNQTKLGRWDNAKLGLTKGYRTGLTGLLRALNGKKFKEKFNVEEAKYIGTESTEDITEGLIITAVLKFIESG